MKILIIEDDFFLGESLSAYLRENGMDVDWVEDDRQVKNILSINEYDVILLDLMLRYSKGEDILLWLRERGITTPVIVITAKARMEDKEKCYEYGADDYITKPFNPKELILKIRALSNRAHIPQVQSIGDVEVDLKNKIVRKGGEEIKISKTAWNLLYYLLKRRGEVVSNESILNYVWGGKAVGDEIIRSYIKELRKIVPPDSIETLKGRGYRLK